MRWAGEGGSGSRSGQESSAWGLRGTLDPTVADVFCLSAWGRAPDWIVFHFGVFPKILLSILRANGLSIMSPGGFQPLGKGTTLTCLSRCDHSSPAGLDRSCVCSISLLWAAWGQGKAVGGTICQHSLHSDFSDTLILVRMCSFCPCVVYVFIKLKKKRKMLNFQNKLIILTI